MILQELCNLYDRLKDDPAYEIPKPGYSLQKISFIVVLNPNGTLFDIQDARTQRGKKFVPREIFVPGTSKPSGSGLNPCILWDNAAYLLGFFEPKNPSEISNDEKKKIERAPKAFESSRAAHIALSEKISAPQFQAVASFFESWNPEKLTEELKAKLRPCSVNFGVFQVLGESRFVHDIPEIYQALECQNSADAQGSIEKAQCLISGRIADIAELHAPAIKGVPGAQSAGAMLVSYNWNAATSYGKKNGGNAPVSREAASAYCLTLNALLRKENHKFRLGDSTVVFWTGKKAAIENDFAFLLDTQSTQDDTKLQQIEAFLKNLRNADSPQTALAQSGYSDSAETPFFMLGISPNAARLAIRFWHAGTLGKFLENLREHHRVMHLQRRGDKDPEFVPLWQILLQTARDKDGIPPLLGGALLRSVIENLPYPQALIRLVLNRIRVDGQINYVRASVLKAFLTRNKKQQITMSLDITNTRPAYLLGRLFAVLEKTQKEAIPGANSGIRERFYASASATPRTAFPILLRTFPHHLAKLDKAREIFYSKLAQQILDGVNAAAGFPAHLNLEAQGLFAIGYYQQWNAFFAKKENSTDTPNE
ncbi:MAG: type I-C CRISPR-associated protein Cas8c/Csd1 [Opitutales bacterium]|nr:type I-C CRISPR-associated protein Cas8c/Csd1 [Opitutales bacterium]